MRKYQAMVVLLAASMVVGTTTMVEGVGADPLLPSATASELSVWADPDEDQLHVAWELWRGLPIDDDAVDEWVVSASGVDDVVVDSTDVGATIDGIDRAAAATVTVQARNEEGVGPLESADYDPADPESPASATGLDVRPSGVPGQLLVSWTPPAVTTPLVDLVRVTWPGGYEDVVAGDPQASTINGLSNGDLAVVTARGQSSQGWGPVVKSAPMAAGTPVLAPIEVTATSTGLPGQVEVMWGEPTPGGEGQSPLDGFEVTWGEGSESLPGNARSTVLSGLVDGRSYVIKVASRNASGPGVRATVANVVPSGPPTEAPVGVQATATGVAGQVSVDWDSFDAAGDGGSDITGFRVSSGATTIDVISSAQAVLEGLADGVEAEVTVEAINQNGVGPSAAAPVTPSGPPTIAPGGVTVAPTTESGELLIAWDLVDSSGDGGSELTGYEIDWGTGTDQVDANSLSFTASGVTDGELADVRVRSRNVNGAGPWSDPLVSGTPGLPLAGPDEVTVTAVSDTSLRVEWDELAAGSVGASAVTDYVVTWNDGSTVIAVGTTEAVLDGLVSGQSYDIDVGARNSSGDGPATSAASVTAGVPTESPSSVAVESTGNNGQIQVTWDSPVAGVTVLDHLVRTDTGVEIVVAAPATTAFIDGLEDGAPVTVTVQSRSTYGAGPWSDSTVAVAPSGPPSVPPGDLVLQPGASTIEVSWSAVLANGGSAVTGYIVSWTDDSGPNEHQAGPDAVTYTIDGLTNGASVEVTVAALNEHGNGPAAAPLNAVPGLAPIAAPSAILADSTDEPGQLEVQWDDLDVSDWGDGTPTGYLISWDGGELEVGLDASPKVIDGLTDGQTYDITISAISDPYGPGVESDPLSATVTGPPTNAPDVTVTVRSGELELAWDEVPGVVSGYTVRWGGQSVELADDARSHLIAGLTDGTSYQLTVAAVNNRGEGAAWEQGWTPGIAPTAAPTGLNAVATGVEGQALVTWDPLPAEAWGTGTTHNYQLWWDGGTAEVSGDDTSYTIDGLANDQESYVTVTASTQTFGWGPAADGVTVWPAAIPTVAPTGVVAQPTDVAGRVHVSWNPAGRPWEIDPYGSWVVEWDGGAQTVGRHLASLDVNGLATDTPLTFTVVARNAWGDGPLSDPSEAVRANGIGTRPNLLPSQGTDFESSEIGWVSQATTISRTSDIARDGALSLRVEVLAGASEGKGVITDSGAGILTTPGVDYRGSVWIRTDATEQEAYGQLVWLSADGSMLGAEFGVPVQASSTDWTEAAVVGTAPSGTARALFRVGLDSIAGGEIVFIDSAVVSADGQPAPNLLTAASSSFEIESGWIVGYATASRTSEVEAAEGWASLRIESDGRGTGWNFPSAGLAPSSAPISGVDGETMTASVQARTDTGSGTALALLAWYDASETLIGFASGPGTTIAEAWSPVTVTSTVPAGAVTVSVGVWVPGGAGTVRYMDDAQVWIGAADATNPTNLLDPALGSFEADSLGWRGDEASIERTVDESRHGYMALRTMGDGGSIVRSDSGQAGIAVVPDRQYTSSAWFKPHDEARPVTVGISWFDAGGALLSDETSDPVDEVPGDWRQVAHTAVAPPGAAFASTEIRIASQTTDEIHYLDDAAFCEGPSPDCLRDTPPINRPSIVTADPGATNDEVLVGWDLAEQNRTNDGVTGYRVRWASGEQIIDDPATQGLLVTGTNAVERFQFEVSALNDFGQGPSSWSPEVATTLAPITAPAGVVATSAYAAPGDPQSITVQWDPYDGAGVDPTGFRVWWGDEAVESITVNADAISTEISTLSGPGPHSFQVAAFNNLGEGPASQAAHAVLGSPCPAPSRSGHAQAILEDEPAAYYRLNEKAEDPNAPFAIDEIGCNLMPYEVGSSSLEVSAVTGALSGSDNAAVKHRGGVDFASEGLGVTLDIPLDSLVGVDAQTVEMWVRHPESGGHLAVLLGQWPFALYDAEGTFPNAELPPIDPLTWHHVVLVTGAANVTLYVDGEVVFADTIPEDFTGLRPEIAGYLSVAQGAIDEVALYPYELSPASVEAHFASAPKQDTTTSLAVIPDQWTGGTPMELMATVAHTAEAPSKPVGEITFSDGSEFLGTAAVDTNGRAVLNTFVPGDGPHKLLAHYSGSATSVASTSAAVNSPASGASTQTSLILGVAASTYGEPVTATVAVTPSGGAATPTGTVEVQLDGQTRHRLQLDNNGTATVGLPVAVAGDHLVTARYQGDAQSGPSVESTGWSVAPAVLEPITPAGLWARVFAPEGLIRPSGELAVSQNGTFVGTAWLYSYLSSKLGGPGGAVAPIDSEVLGLSDGEQALAYEFPGDARYQPISWAVEGDIVTELRLYNDLAFSVPGDNPVFLASVYRDHARNVSGDVSFFLDGALVDVVPLVEGVATWTPTGLTVGPHEVTVEFRGLSATRSHFFGHHAVVEVDDPDIEWGGVISGSVVSATEGVTEVPQGSVHIHTAGQSLDQVEVQSDGTFMMSANQEVAVGTTGFEYTFHPDRDLDSTFVYTAEALDPSPVIMKAVTTASLSVTTANVAAGHDLPFRVDLGRTNSQPATGEVTLYLDGSAESLGTWQVPSTGPVTGTIEAPPAGPHTLRVEYGGSDTMLESDVMEPFEIGLPTTLDIQVEPSVSDPLGAQVTVTVSAPGDQGFPTGTLKVEAGAGPNPDTVNVDLVQADMGVATFDVHPPLGGMQPITVSYEDGPNWQPSNASTTWTFAKPTELSLTFDSDTVLVGEPVGFTVLASNPRGTGTPTGELTIKQSPGEEQTLILDGAGQASGTWIFPAHGNKQLVATLSPGDGWAAPDAVSEGITVTPKSVSVELGVASIESTYGTLPSGDLSVAASNGGDVPQLGELVFWADDSDGASVELGRAPPDVDGNATIDSGVVIAPGTYTLRATYTGDTIYGTGSSDPGVEHTVTRATPTLVLTSPTADLPGDVFADEPVDLVATLAGPAGTDDAIGFVTFRNGAEVLGTTEADVTASLTVPALGGGTHTITASYGGSPRFDTASGQVSIDVTKRPTTTTLVLPELPTDIGDPVTLEASVIAADDQAVTAGAITFLQGTDVLATVPVETDGTASHTATLGVGEHAIIASYSGTDDLAESESVSDTHLVARPTLVDVSPAAAELVFGATSEIEVVVTAPTAVAFPTGRVRLVGPGDTLGDWVSVDGEGLAGLSAQLPVGRQTLTVEYEGTSELAPAVSEPFDQVINKVVPTVQLTATPYLVCRP